MISQIINVQNVGRFKKFVPDGDVQLKDYTLILADNGVGKTTLCDVIRSLQTNDPSYVTGRRTLGCDGEPTVHFRLSDGSHARFRNGAWDTQRGGVTIFDATYVRDNIHAGETVDTAHKRNLFQVVVGSAGVGLVRQVEQLERERGELGAPIREVEAQIKPLLPPGMTPRKFLDLTADDDIESKLTTAQQNLRSVEELADLKLKRPLAEATVPTVPTTFRSLLSTSLENVSDEAEGQLRAHIANLGTDDAGQWLARGHEIAGDSKSCPFCKQDLGTSDIVSAYRACFSAAYRDLREDVRNLAEELATALPPDLSATLRAIEAENRERLSEREKYVGDQNLPSLDADGCVEAVNEIRRLGIDLITRKRRNLLCPLSIPTSFDEAEAALVQCASNLTAYNKAVSSANAAFRAHVSATGANDPDELRARLVHLEAMRERHRKPTVALCSRYKELLAEKKRLTSEKDAAKERLSEYVNTVVGQYEGSVNKYLRNFGVNFRIQGTTTEFPRGIPSSDYKVEIEGVEVGLGTTKTDNAEPSFKNTLSAGDRSALALAFFMAELDRSTTSPELAVILDDPFQSQDHFRRNATAHRIKEAGEKCGQVIMFSHDPNFLKTVWDLLPKDKRKCLVLKASKHNVALANLDIDEHVRGEHLKQLDAVQGYVETGDGQVEDVVRNLRPLLEWYCRAHCPSRFEGLTLGEIIGAVRKEGSAHQLAGLLEELTEINDYAQKHHHATRSTSSAIDDQELHAHCVRTIDILRARAVLN